MKAQVIYTVNGSSPIIEIIEVHSPSEMTAKHVLRDKFPGKDIKLLEFKPIYGS